MTPTQTVAAPIHEEEKRIEEKVLTIEEKIRVEAIERNYSPDRAVAIAKAESGLNPNARNPHSTASGTYQFINSTFKEYCIKNFAYADSMEQKNDPDIQIKCAVRMLSEGGENHWDASRKMWEDVK